jgi:hypothetical protein
MLFFSLWLLCLCGEAVRCGALGHVVRQQHLRGINLRWTAGGAPDELPE